MIKPNYIKKEDNNMNPNKELYNHFLSTKAEYIEVFGHRATKLEDKLIAKNTSVWFDRKKDHELFWQKK